MTPMSNAGRIQAIRHAKAREPSVPRRASEANVASHTPPAEPSDAPPEAEAVLPQRPYDGPQPGFLYRLAQCLGLR